MVSRLESKTLANMSNDSQ